jgi:hypothetical protein
MSYFEIGVGGQIKDLLDPEKESQGMAVQGDAATAVRVTGLTEQVVGSAEQVMELLLFGEANRAVHQRGGRSSHSTSSSSASAAGARREKTSTVFRLVVESVDANAGATTSSSSGGTNSGSPVSVSVLTVVELAGSETVIRTAPSPSPLSQQVQQQQVHAKFMDKSLAHLSTLCTKSKSARSNNEISSSSSSSSSSDHDQTRSFERKLIGMCQETTLSHFLSPCFVGGSGGGIGGSCRTLVIAAIDIATVHRPETRRTLKFAMDMAQLEVAPVRYTIQNTQLDICHS